MSELEVKDNEKSNMTPSGLPSRVPTQLPTQPTQEWQGEMTRPQALAVSWTGLQVLAMNGQLVMFNDKKTGIAWFGIANARVERQELSKAIRLVDMEAEPTLANASEVLAVQGAATK